MEDYFSITPSREKVPYVGYAEWGIEYVNCRVYCFQKYNGRTKSRQRLKLRSDMEDLKNSVEVSSRMRYIKNPKAINVADFVIGYSFRDSEEVYTNGTILVPLFRVLDALSMIDKDKIQYYDACN